MALYLNLKFLSILYKITAVIFFTLALIIYFVNLSVDKKSCNLPNFNQEIKKLNCDPNNYPHIEDSRSDLYDLNNSLICYLLICSIGFSFLTITWNIIEDLAKDEFTNLKIKLSNTTFSIKELSFFSHQFTEFLKVFRYFIILSICLIIFKTIRSQDYYSNEITVLGFDLMPEIFRARILILSKLNCTNSAYLPNGYISKLIIANECNFQLFNIQQIVINLIFSVLIILIIFNLIYLNQLFLLINLKWYRKFILHRILPKNIDKKIIEILSNDYKLFFTIYTMRILKNKCYQKVIYHINRNTIGLNLYLINKSSLIDV